MKQAMLRHSGSGAVPTVPGPWRGIGTRHQDTWAAGEMPSGVARVSRRAICGSNLV